MKQKQSGILAVLIALVLLLGLCVGGAGFFVWRMSLAEQARRQEMILQMEERAMAAEHAAAQAEEARRALAEQEVKLAKQAAQLSEREAALAEQEADAPPVTAEP